MDIDALRKQLEIDEGKRLVVYLDSEGLPTVGIGHLVQEKDNLKLGDVISEERCIELFDKDVQIALASCHRVFPLFSRFPEEVKQIMANMMFNLGETRFRNFRKMIAAVENRDWKEAARQMEDSKWYRQVKSRGKRLVSRMEALARGG